jgi:Helix-turn-helix domain
VAFFFKGMARPANNGKCDMSPEHAPRGVEEQTPLYEGHLNDDVVLTLDEVARLTRQHVQTLRVMIRTGKGPKVIHLNARRLGVQMRELRRWMKSRTE